MQISNRFTLAVYILVYIETFKNDFKVSSEFLARSTNVNPAVIRKILRQLKAANIIEGGKRIGCGVISRPLEEITLLDIYRAVEYRQKGKSFLFHEKPDMVCDVGKRTYFFLEKKLGNIQYQIEQELHLVTMADVIEEKVQVDVPSKWK